MHVSVQMTKRLTAVVLLGFVIGMTIVVWYWPRTSQIATLSATDPDSTQIQYTETQPEPPQTRYGELADPTGDRMPFSPEDVLGNQDCQMVTGPENANNIAVVHMEDSDGTVFAIVGPEGVLGHSFVPIKNPSFRLGLNTDGTVLVGVSARPPLATIDSARVSLVTVYRDNEVIFETTSGSSFTVDPNGTFFAVHEMEENGQSSLVVRDIDEDSEFSIELPAALSPTTWQDNVYRIFYTLGRRQVIFNSFPRKSGHNDYWFFDLEEHQLHKVSVAPTHYSVLTSSSNGYFLNPQDGSTYGPNPENWKIERAQLNYMNDVRHVLWSRGISDNEYKPGVSVSGNGAWLTVYGQTVYVLDASTGDTIFEIPRFITDEIRDARFTNAPSDAITFKGREFVQRIGMTGNTMFLTRVGGDKSACDSLFRNPETRDQYPDCVEDLRERGEYRKMIDVFDLTTVYPDSLPEYSREMRDWGRCVPRIHPFNGLDVVNEKLVYVPFLDKHE